MTTARSISVGFRSSVRTTITITLPSVDTTATAKYYDASGTGTSITRNGAEFEVELNEGDYALVLCSTLRPDTGSDAFTVSFSSSVLLWSAQHPDPGTGIRPWESGTGATVSVQDPKDPWPQLTGANTASNSFVSTSSLATKMGSLLTANAGRSGVEEDDAAAAAS